jgi:hypothetical protein
MIVRRSIGANIADPCVLYLLKQMIVSDIIHQIVRLLKDLCANILIGHGQRELHRLLMSKSRKKVRNFSKKIAFKSYHRFSWNYQQNDGIDAISQYIKRVHSLFEGQN